MLDSGAAWRRCGAGNSVELRIHAGNQRRSKAYIYTDRPVYRPGHTVHIKAIVRKEKDDALVLPDERTLKLTVTGRGQQDVFSSRICRFQRMER